MGELINMVEYVEQKELNPTMAQKYRRLGEISLEITMLEIERARLEES